MRINHVVEKPDGSVTFQGNLEGAELAFVMEVGIGTLLKEGAIPFVHGKSVKFADIADEPEATQ